MWLREGDAFRSPPCMVTCHKPISNNGAAERCSDPVTHVLLSRVAISGQPLQVADLRTDASYLSGDPLPVAAADVDGRPHSVRGADAQR